MWTKTAVEAINLKVNNTLMKSDVEEDQLQNITGHSNL